MSSRSLGSHSGAAGPDSDADSSDMLEVPYLPSFVDLLNEATPTIRDLSGTWVLDRRPAENDVEPNTLALPKGRMVLSQAGPASDVESPAAHFQLEDAPKGLEYDRDAMDTVFSALGVGMVIRAVLYRTDMKQHLVHTRTELSMHELSVNVKRKLLLDGQWRPTEDNDGSRQRCWSGKAGEVITETVLPAGRGTMFDQRVLVRRDLLRHDIAVVLSRRIVACATSFLRRLETDEERQAAEEAEQYARAMTAHALTGVGQATQRQRGGKASRNSKVGAGPGRNAVVSQQKSPEELQDEITRASTEAQLQAVCPQSTSSYCGSWANVPSHAQSDNIDGLLAALGVPWLARGMAASVVITSTMDHRRGATECEDQDTLAGRAVGLPGAVPACFDHGECAASESQLGQEDTAGPAAEATQVEAGGEEDSNESAATAASAGAATGSSPQPRVTAASVTDGPSQQGSVGPGVIVTTDASSFGSGTSAVVLDGVARLKTGDDGKSTVSRAWIGRKGGGGPRWAQVRPSEEASAQTGQQWVYDCASPECDAQLSALQEGEILIEVVLPDDKGVTIDRRTPFWDNRPAMLDQAQNARARNALCEHHPHGPFLGFFSTTTLIQYPDSGETRDRVLAGAIAGSAWSGGRVDASAGVLQRPQVVSPDSSTTGWQRCKVTVARRVSECTDLAAERKKRHEACIAAETSLRLAQEQLEELRKRDSAAPALDESPDVDGADEDSREEGIEPSKGGSATAGQLGLQTAFQEVAPHADVSGLWAIDLGRSRSPQALLESIRRCFASAEQFRKSAVSDPPRGMGPGEAQEYLADLRKLSCSAGPGVDATHASQTVWSALPVAADLVLAAGGPEALRMDRAEASGARLHINASRFRLECRMAKSTVLTPGASGTTFASIPPVALFLDGRWRSVQVSKHAGRTGKMWVRARTVYKKASFGDHGPASGAGGPDPEPARRTSVGSQASDISSSERDTQDVVVEVLLPIAPTLTPAVLRSSIPTDAPSGSCVYRASSGVKFASAGFARLDMSPPVGIGLPAQEGAGPSGQGDEAASLAAWPQHPDDYTTAPALLVSHLRIRTPPSSHPQRSRTWMQQTLQLVRAMQVDSDSAPRRVMYDLLDSTQRVWVRDESEEQRRAGESAWVQQEREWEQQRQQAIRQMEEEREKEREELLQHRAEPQVLTQPKGAASESTSDADVDVGWCGTDLVVRCAILLLCLAWSAAVLWRLQSAPHSPADNHSDVSAWSAWGVGSAGGLVAWGLAEGVWPTCRRRCAAHAAEIAQQRRQNGNGSNAAADRGSIQ